MPFRMTVCLDTNNYICFHGVYSFSGQIKIRMSCSYEVYGLLHCESGKRLIATAASGTWEDRILSAMFLRLHGSQSAFETIPL